MTKQEKETAASILRSWRIYQEDTQSWYADTDTIFAWLTEKYDVFPKRNVKVDWAMGHDKTAIGVQMPCGCLVGSHPPGPCGFTGIGQET